MLFWKKKVDVKKEIDDMNSKLQTSFSKVRQDTSSIFQWVEYLQGLNQQQQNMIEHQNATIGKQQMLVQELIGRIDYLPTRQEIKAMADQHFSAEPLLSRIRELELKTGEFDNLRDNVSHLNTSVQNIAQELHTLAQDRDPVFRRLRELSEEISVLKQKKSTTRKAFKERIVEKVTRNSKEYVKNMLISMIRKYGRISALQLRDIVVEEQALCSKSSFYRLLEEMEDEDEIAVLQKGKEKHYISKLPTTKQHEPQ